MSGYFDKDQQQKLLHRCKSGDESAFGELYDIISGKVFGNALRILGNQQDAEDALQEIFIKVFKSIRNFRGDSSLVTWIYRIAVNTCFDIVRQRKRDITEEIDNIELEQPTQSSKEIDKFLEHEIRKLPRNSRTVFILVAIEGFKHKEVAEIMGTTVGTSKSQYFAAKAQLRKSLKPYKEILIDG